MSRIPVHHQRIAGTRLSRRTLLADLGRVTLGAVVLGGLAACTDDDAEAEATSRSTSDGETSGDGERAPVSAGASTGPLSWLQASFGFVSAYVLVRDGEALVFDTGTGDDITAIGDALEAAGVGWDAVGHVLVSHRHGDHAGGIELVAEQAPDAVFYAAEPDLSGFRDRVETAQEVADGDLLLGLRVVATPGHTLGHVSAIDDETGLLLAGDAIVRDREIGGTTGQGIEASPPDFTEDTDQALASVRLLADLAPSTIVFGHGDPLREDAAGQLQTYADSL